MRQNLAVFDQLLVKNVCNLRDHCTLPTVSCKFRTADVDKVTRTSAQSDLGEISHRQIVLWKF